MLYCNGIVISIVLSYHSVDIIRLESFGWNHSVGIIRLESFGWNNSAGIIRLVSFGWYHSVVYN